MSYSLIPYVIDLDKLRQAVGGKDALLVEAVRQASPELFEPDEEGRLSLGQAVTQLVMGERLDEKQGHRYGYALEKLAKHLGKGLAFDLWCGVDWRALVDSGLEPLLQSGPPVALPNIEDFPHIAFLERGEIAAAVEKMGEEGLTHDEAELAEMLEEFSGWLYEAAQVKVDLLFFYY